jgi:hypothetical protein
MKIIMLPGRRKTLICSTVDWGPNEAEIFIVVGAPTTSGKSDRSLLRRRASASTDPCSPDRDGPANLGAEMLERINHRRYLAGLVDDIPPVRILRCQAQHLRLECTDHDRRIDPGVAPGEASVTR